MDLYEENENVISSDEYSDDDYDDDALMNDAVRAQDLNHSNTYTYQSQQPKWKIDHKQKELNSLIRKNKIFVIYKNKSIKWLNNKRHNSRYKQRICLNRKKNGVAPDNASSPILEEEHQHEGPRNICRTQSNEIVSIEDNTDQVLNISEKEEVIEEKEITPKVFTNMQPVNDQRISEKTISIGEENNVEPIKEFQTNKMLGKKEPSVNPSILNETIGSNPAHNEKIIRVSSPEFYKSINEIFPKFDNIASNHIDNIANTSLNAVENKIKSLSTELDTLNDILRAKEIEWNRLLHLKMVKEEIRSRLNNKCHILQLKEKLSKTQSENVLLELKELDLYLSEKRTTSETSHSMTTIQKLIENRANMNADDLKREKEKTSRLHSLLVSQNMLHAAESFENSSLLNNSEKNSIVSTSKTYEIRKHLDESTPISNICPQGDARDVTSLVADFRKKNSELLPRLGKRIKSIGSNIQRIPLLEFEKTPHPQYLNKDLQSESYVLPNFVDDLSIASVDRSTKLSSKQRNTDFVNEVNKLYSVRVEDRFRNRQLKADFDTNCSKNLQYPLCQECKSNESRFVCAGCGNQWYCSKKCQISAWDRHSELCTE